MNDYNHYYEILNKRPSLFVRFSTLLFGYESIKVFAHIFTVEEQIFGRSKLLGDRNCWIIEFFGRLKCPENQNEFDILQIEILNRFKETNYTVQIRSIRRNSMNSQDIVVIALEKCANHWCYLFFQIMC